MYRRTQKYVPKTTYYKNTSFSTVLTVQKSMNPDICIREYDKGLTNL